MRDMGHCHARGRTRTCDLRLRRPTLYPTELRAQCGHQRRRWTAGGKPPERRPAKHRRVRQTEEPNRAGGRAARKRGFRCGGGLGGFGGRRFRRSEARRLAEVGRGTVRPSGSRAPRKSGNRPDSDVRNRRPRASDFRRGRPRGPEGPRRLPGHSSVACNVTRDRRPEDS